MSPEVSDYLNPSSRPFSFCPGCSHGTVLEALAGALAELELPTNRVVLVSDIGCIGISDKHFETHTFHGLHGRSVTYACGLKLARPELTVVVLVGDGGLGIGGHHFLHAARRNMDITVLVCNNFNFGMTGGQHSVTTPHQGITATTSVGNFEHPLDVTGLVDVAQGNFAARAMFYDKELPGLIAAGIRSPGFAAVEVWEMCTAYFAKRNRVNRGSLEKSLEQTGARRGIVVQRDRPGYLEQYQRGLEALRGEPVTRGTLLPRSFEPGISQRRTVLISGRAGQKVRSTAIVLGRAAALSGLYVTQRDDYPVTVMTGHSTAEMIFQPDSIHELGVDIPDYVVLTAPEGRDNIAEKLRCLPPESVVYSVPDLLPLDTPAQVEVVPVDELGLGKRKTQLVLGCTSYFVRQTGLLDMQALVRSVKTESRAQIAEENLATLRGLL